VIWVWAAFTGSWPCVLGEGEVNEAGPEVTLAVTQLMVLVGWMEVVFAAVSVDVHSIPVMATKRERYRKY
jgi:hypothetical protein